MAKARALARGRLERDPRLHFRLAREIPSIDAATFFNPASSPAPRCAPGCKTRNGSPS